MLKKVFLFFINFLGVYILLFLSCLYVHVNESNIISDRADGILAKSMHDKNSLLIEIAATQNMRRKTKPSFFKPHILFTAIFGEREHYKEINKSLGKAVEGLKSNLNQANLSKAILPDADLSKGSMILTQLNSANLNGADLQYANLFMADLRKTLLKGANLSTAINITCEQIQSAVIDKNTQFPDYIQITGSPGSTYQCKDTLKEK